MTKVVKRALEAREIEAPSISMVSAGSDRNWSVNASSGFVMDVEVWSDAFTSSLRGDMTPVEFINLQPQPFQWDPDSDPDERVAESSHKEKYLEYLRQFIVMPRDMVRLITTPNKMFDLEDAQCHLGFNLTGTSDSTICILDTEVERAASITPLAVRALIEVKKKDINESDLKQAAAKLIAADIHSQFTIFVVLTDLADDWRFLWLKPGRKIMVTRVPDPTADDSFVSRRAASLLLRRLLADATHFEAERKNAAEFVEALPISIDKRQKLSQAIKERHSIRGEESDAAVHNNDTGDVDSADDESADGRGRDDEDHKMILFHKVRKIIRHTPWLQEVCRADHRSATSSQP